MSNKKLQHLKNIEIRKYIARRGLFVQIPITQKMKSCEAEITLGRAVLDRALLDGIEDNEAEQWFDKTNENFLTFCFIANLEPELVVTQAKTVIERMKRNEVVGDLLEKLID